MNDITYKFFRKTGYKFYGNDEEFLEKQPHCDDSLPRADEEGYFDDWYCCVDFKICDKQCSKHHPKLNPDISEFVSNLNESLGRK